MRILSLGAGVQSSTLALLAAHGEIEPPDAAIFADTGWEPKHVLDWLDWLETHLPFPIYRVMHRSGLKNAILQKNSRFASVPFFTERGGIGRRQCTAEFKINPIQKKVRELLGYEPRKRIPIGAAPMLIGISLDEVMRMKPSRVAWINHEWPLIDRRMSRADCLAWMAKNRYPMPPKSSCLGCPFHSDRQWIEIKNGNPDEWAETILIDKNIRKTKTKEQQYMHRSLRPLEDVDFSMIENQHDLFNNECEGMCGV